MEQEYLSVRELATLLGVHYTTAMRLVQKDRIPHIRVGRIIRINRVDAETRLRQQPAPLSKGKRKAAVE